MSTGKRLAKRSILGTRVVVPGQDGRWLPAVIHGSKTSADRPGPIVYSVLLDDKSSREYSEKEIVGPGFQPLSVVKIVPGQVVFLTHNGREVSGTVTSQSIDAEEVTVSVGINGQKTEVAKRLEEIRLLESRKSARLQDLDQDYSRLADFGAGESRKRMTSSGIDVPTSHTHGNRKRRPSSSSEVDQFDDCAAAMVLMSLSCSPKSPRLPGYLSEASGFFSRSWTESSLTSSSGASSWQSGQSQRTGTPSPPSILSESAPSSISTPGTNQQLQDEGIEMDETLGFMDDTLPRKRRNSTRTLFKCTWPGCKTVTGSCDLIEKHVRLVHLNRMESDDGDSDHEEELYYNEVEVSIDAVSDSFANMQTSSPPSHMDLSHLDMARPPYEDPEYQRSLQMSPMKQSKVGTRLTASPKPSPLRHRKCRKVYGMENRDMWCTQCKWKKACSRFNDISLPPV